MEMLADRIAGRCASCNAQIPATHSSEACPFCTAVLPDSVVILLQGVVPPRHKGFYPGTLRDEPIRERSLTISAIAWFYIVAFSIHTLATLWVSPLSLSPIVLLGGPMFSIAGLVSAIGLLKRQEWARLCFTVLVSLSAAAKLFGLGLCAIGLMYPPSVEQLPPRFRVENAMIILAAGAVALLIMLLFNAVVIYFVNSRKARLEFLQLAPNDSRA